MENEKAPTVIYFRSILLADQFVWTVKFEWIIQSISGCCVIIPVARPSVEIAG